jgi:putative membrane protein insertion efficiency factor
VSGRSIVLGALNAYRRWISPLLPPACRFHPTCSVYARDAVALHGVWRGGALALWRLMRCQPFGRGGFDPVPPARSRAAGRLVG